MNGPTPLQCWAELAPQWMLDSPEWLEDIFFNIYKCFIHEERYMLFI